MGSTAGASGAGGTTQLDLDEPDPSVPGAGTADPSEPPRRELGHSQLTAGGLAPPAPGTGIGALLAPRDIAVVGASRDPAKWGRRVLEYTQRAGFSGRLYGVNPVTPSLGLPGVTTVPALTAITDPVDLVVIARPAAAVPSVLAECVATGARAVLVTAAGFGELGGSALTAERELVAAVRAAGVRLLGPNTFGLFVTGHRIDLTPREFIPTGSIALLSQSGNVAVALYEQARQAGIGFSACVGVGNQIDVDFADLLTYFAADEHTSAVALYAEGLRGPGAGARLVSGLAACRAAGKPVVVLKAGRSAQAAGAVQTHTGALAADDRVWQTVLDQAGALRVTSTQDLIDSLAVLTNVPRHRGRVMVLTDGGGDSVLAVDALTAAGLTLAEPSPASRARLDELTPPAAPRTATRNPVTLDTPGGVEDDPLLLARCAAVAACDDGVDAILVGGLFGGYPRLIDGELASAAELIAIRESGVPVIAASAFAASGSKPVEVLRRAGVPVFPDVSRLARALVATVTPATDDITTASTGTAGPGTTSQGSGSQGSGSQGSGSAAAGEASAAGGSAAAAAMPAEQVAALLASYGITLPTMSVVTSPAELAEISASVSYPSCIKINDPAITHKSDVGGVRLRLPGPAELIAAGDDLWQLFPGSPMLVMPFLDSGPELLVGTGHDPAFGAYVLVGRGGIWAETDPDVAIRLAPADSGTALRALLSLRCAPMLTGGRGTKPVDLTALAELVAAMSRLGAEHPDLGVEMNPVIAYPGGYAVADLRATASPAG